MRKAALAFCLASFAALLALGGGSMMYGARVGAWAGRGMLTAKDYVQDGLIAMWDAIENGANHQHDSTLNKNTWVEWCGTGWVFDIDRTGSRFTDNCFVQTEQRTAYNYLISTALRNVFNTTYTWQAIYSPRIFDDDALTSTCPLIGTYGGNNPARNICSEVCNTAKIGSEDSIGIGKFAEKDSPLFLTWRLNYENAVADYEAITGQTKHSAQKTLLTSAPSVSYIYSQPWLRGLHCMRVYNRILTAAEVATNYAIDKARFGLEG